MPHLLPHLVHGKDGIAARDGALVDSDVGELAELALLQLEGQPHEGVVGVARQLDLLLLVVRVEGDVGHLNRRGQVARHPIEQPLDA